MKPRKNKWIKIIGYPLLGFLFLLSGLVIYLASVALVYPPEILDKSSLNLIKVRLDSNCYTIGNNWIRKSKSGIWEMYIEGDAYERGVINGKLSEELVFKQEKAFHDQICKMVPSAFYRSFLKYFIGWFNRDLDENITEEYKQEIYGVSGSASSKFDYIGSGYQRLMNYHAAHDIGHALQNMALVGCSSFATWNDRSLDSQLIVGRNFDFYVGDKFAENKIVLFCNPAKGHKFMMVTWGGMTGVVSGMNMEGLTVTLNSAKSDIPAGSATPVSLLAREILQYASNIQEALEIAKLRKTFVSESFLISSVKDNKAVNIEKTPEAIDLYDPGKNYIICTNHYEGKGLQETEINKEQMATSASVYRKERMEELLTRIPKNSPLLTAGLLRDQEGSNGTNIGYGNEKAVNQLVAHHSIIFNPSKKIAWISTAPWQLGSFISYDLQNVFSMKGLEVNREICDSSFIIKEDPFIYTREFRNFIEFRKLKEDFLNGKEIDVMRLIELNPEYYHAYVIAGDYKFKRKLFSDAMRYYQTALTKVIATKAEEEYAKNRIEECKIR